MKKCTANITGISPYSQNKALQSPLREGESPDAHDARCWRERMHHGPDGQCYIPPNAMKLMMGEAAKFTSRKGPTGKSSTWTKNFISGVMVSQPLYLGVHFQDVREEGSEGNDDVAIMQKYECMGESLFVPSDGKPGGSRRVWKRFPTFTKWGGDIVFQIVDNQITEEIFATYLREAGVLIGLGRFRVINRGWYGRFTVNSIKWEDFIV